MFFFMQDNLTIGSKVRYTGTKFCVKGVTFYVIKVLDRCVDIARNPEATEGRRVLKTDVELL